MVLVWFYAVVLSIFTWYVLLELVNPQPHDQRLKQLNALIKLLNEQVFLLVFRASLRACFLCLRALLAGLVPVAKEKKS